MDTPSNNQYPMRLSKYLATFCSISRREAEKAVMSGAVLVNGIKPKNAASIISENDNVAYDSIKAKTDKVKLNENEQIICCAIYKPVGLIVTRSDEQSRQTIYSILPQWMYDFHYVGRLDLNSEGILLFTNSSSFARKLENPKTGIERIYHVKAHGMLDQKKLIRMQKGVMINGESYKPEQIKILPRTKDSSSNTWLEITLKSGKNREIRKLLEHFNLQVAKLIRHSFGNISITNFNHKGVYRLTDKERNRLMDNK